MSEVPKKPVPVEIPHDQIIRNKQLQDLHKEKEDGRKKE